MKRIALISEKYPPDVGGLAVSVARLTRMLVGAGNQVQVFALSVDIKPGVVEHFDDGGVLVSRMGAYRRDDDTLADWFDQIVARHRDRSFDLLHAYYATRAAFAAVYAAGCLGLPSLVSARGNDLERAVFDPRKAAHVLYALANANAITANTRLLARKAQALAPGRPVFHIPNGVDTALFQPLPRSDKLVDALGLSGKRIIGFVGEARAKKGLAGMLLAVKILAGQYNLALLLLGGVRPGSDTELVTVFRKQNQEVPVFQLPYVSLEETPAFYALMDVLLMPSRRDGLPNALLEGMACQRPIVATSVGGIPDAIQDGENGLLVPPDDPDAIVAAVKRLLDNPGLSRRLGHAARATVLREFTPQIELESTLALYNKLLGEV
jgi:glycosyltransferase involved in cell wall biosynthesis